MDNFKRIYFGHPVASFNTKEERHLIRRIREAFPDYDLENPNQPHHRERCEIYRAKTGKVLDYFFTEVLPHMDAGIFVPFSDGKWGIGVFKEAQFMANAGKQIYEISLEGIITNMVLDETKVLSLEETKARLHRKL